MAEGGEGEDEIQFLRTVSVSLLLLEQNTGAAVRVHCVFLLGSVSVRACVLWCGLGVYRIKGWQLLHIEVTGQGVRIMLTGDQGWRRRENALTERQDKQMRGGERCVVVLSLFIKRSWAACSLRGGAGVVYWVDAGRSAVQTGSMKPATSAALRSSRTGRPSLEGSCGEISQSSGGLRERRCCFTKSYTWMIAWAQSIFFLLEGNRWSDIPAHNILINMHSC